MNTIKTDGDDIYIIDDFGVIVSKAKNLEEAMAKAELKRIRISDPQSSFFSKKSRTIPAPF